jgi:hypothetical protein
MQFILQKTLNIQILPNKMFLDSNEIPSSERADVNVNVYNGKRKAISNEVKFMDQDSITECIKQ